MYGVTDELSKLLADTYALYLKTQNYHWHVKGPHFKTLHLLFEEQYQELAQSVDDIAERIVTLEEKAPATFSEFNRLKTIEDGDSSRTAEQMITDLYNDHQKIIIDLKKSIEIAQKNNDDGSLDLLTERLAHHEKIRWMLGASR